ncbi:MAG TPA: protein kinase [Thermoanaerobaculia bacterium]|nr:protein kinase [Thermoanaerobaculia bacterium]
MTLIGRRLGPYEIGALLGAGGMGEVYRATDTRLGRTVAVKVLPPQVAMTAERRARFEREARAIAALSHPHICAVHDVGTDDGTEYLVMEYLEGETLADRIARGPLPPTLVIRYGVQIAEALHHAHRAGITHRDLKPGNIMITAAGVKLLDFGLAKSIAASEGSNASELPTQVVPVTAEGTIVGTVQYMSPEQLEGHLLDHRTDLFSLGVILFEMATGQRPFTGGSPSAIIASIFSSDPPPVRSLQPALPPALERIIATALEKNRDDRWQTAHDVARQLRWLLESSGTSETLDRAAPRRRIPAAAAFAAVALLAALATWGLTTLLRRGGGDIAMIATELSAPAGMAFGGDPDVTLPAISPDGRRIAFVGIAGGERALYVRDLGSYAVTKIDGTQGAMAPFWSSDGEWLGFSARGKLWRTLARGQAQAEPVCDVAAGGATASWHGDTILFADAPAGRAEIFRVSAGGRTPPAAVTKPQPGEWRHAWPLILPDGKHFLYLSFSATSMDREIVLATLDGRKKSVLLRNVSLVRLGGPEQLLYVRDGNLLAQRVDIGRGVMIGEARTVAARVAYFYPNARAVFDGVTAGTIVYRTDTRTTTLVRLDRAGVQKQVLGNDRYFDVSLSPDSMRAAVTVVDSGNGLGDIWIYDLARGVRDRLTSDPGMEFSPLWSADQRAIFYSSAQGGTVPHIVRRDLGSGATAELTGRGVFRWPVSVSSDGASLYFAERNTRTKFDAFRLALPDGKPEPLLVSEFAENDPMISPDGRWLAYVSDAAGSSDVYLRDAAGNGARIRVSPGGGFAPRWSGDGRELTYLAPDGRTILSARTPSGRWEDASTTTLFATKGPVLDFAPLRGDEGFLVIEETAGPRDELLHVIVGWRER